MKCMKVNNITGVDENSFEQDIRPKNCMTIIRGHIMVKEQGYVHVQEPEMLVCLFIN